MCFCVSIRLLRTSEKGTDNNKWSSMNKIGVLCSFHNEFSKKKICDDTKKNVQKAWITVLYATPKNHRYEIKNWNIAYKLMTQVHFRRDFFKNKSLIVFQKIVKKYKKWYFISTPEKKIKIMKICLGKLKISTKPFFATYLNKLRKI